MRWSDYVMAYNGDIRGLWEVTSPVGRQTVFVVGVGFDPRALIGLKSFAAQAAGPTTVAVLQLPSGRGGRQTSDLADANQIALDLLLKASGMSTTTVPYPTGADRRSAGQVISRLLQASGAIARDSTVIVDVSSLPATLAFPVIGGMLEAADAGRFVGDLQVLVCENPLMDQAIIHEGATDPGPIAGFNHGLSEEGDDRIVVWSPVLGEGQREQLDTLYTFLQPREVIPVLPFPAANPRRADDLMLEYRELLFDRIVLEPGDLIYAGEANPFDVYRALWRLNDRLHKALEPIGLSTLVSSVHGSKMLSMGVLLAAWDCKLPIVAATPTDYEIRKDADLDEIAKDNRLACLWLTGDPYR